MILAVDCGNSRLKWGLHDNGGWRKTGTVPVSELGRLEKSWKRLVAAGKVVVADGGGGAGRKKAQTLFAPGSMVPPWVKAERRGGGGPDRHGRPVQRRR